MNELQQGYSNKLKNRLYGLLCEFEKDGEWESFLDSILIELSGIPKEIRGINFYSLYANIAALRYVKYKYFRKTIFDCMTILGREDEIFEGDI